MALMLAYYEIISATSTNAYFQHINGAETLLKSMESHIWQDSQLHDLYSMLRLHVLYASIRKSFTSKPWKTLAWRGKQKTVFDKTIDLITDITAITCNRNRGDTTDFVADTLSALSEIVFQLESIGQALGIDHQQVKSTNAFLLPDSDTAVTVAYYSLGWLLISPRIQKFNHLHKEEVGKIVAINDQFISLHCSNILRASTYLDDCRDGCAYVRMILPLKAVVEFGPEKLQRDMARYRLEAWRARRGLAGICAIAFALKIEAGDSS
ncbi:hypothetical protein BGW36DRAFT_433392 [Talaromyces proteolyticus]|uniref:Uncharacterized protein n=1 Tax=Talaromyces proteolyticus TaxID=1131652 RepID=A0AAD4KDR3_9EURO|nr:uncharacterized protein BGW36DRAFT_433392 [Talaromyces proteolyticus]KAH8689389.1 hypothetical protein BGW36DRAFT_433392 [Talaromyces proteolyticus]